jgi:hypothetical protein
MQVICCLLNVGPYFDSGLNWVTIVRNKTKSCLPMIEHSCCVGAPNATFYDLDENWHSESPWPKSRHLTLSVKVTLTVKCAALLSSL